MRIESTSNFWTAVCGIAAILAVPVASGQSCDGILCNTDYTVRNDLHSSRDHEGIVIEVGNVGTDNAYFIFAKGTHGQEFTCDHPDVTNSGETLSCTESTGNSGRFETVAVGVIGGEFCNALHTIGSFTRVISAEECDDGAKCACFMVEEHRGGVGDSRDKTEDAEARANLRPSNPPSRGTGSGGSP